MEDSCNGRPANTDQRNGFRQLRRGRPCILSKSETKKYIIRKAKTYHFIGQYFAKKGFSHVAKRLPLISQWYTKHFPAVRLNHKLSPLEYSLNFSSEILVAIFVVVIAALNLIVFNPLKADYSHQDKSLAAELLRNHTNLNNQLALKHNMISTTVSDSNGFISKAFADNNAGMVLGATDTANAEITEDGIEDNGINKASPDTIQKLVSQQVTIYETKPFDTVYTVAEQFKLTPRTIRETNGLPDNALKAGWFLVIPPVDGIVVKVTNSDLTVGDIAEKYRADLNKVASYNGLGPDSELAMEEYVIVPGGTLPEPPAPAPAPTAPAGRTPTTSKIAAKPSVPRAAFKGSNKFASGQCTDYAARMTGWVDWRGNASAWAGNARANGHTVNRTPAVGSIIQTNESKWGHVGYIEAVNGTKVTFSEWNYAGPYKKTTRTLDINSSTVKAIIHR